MLKRIKDFKNLGCEWDDLRNDRERKIATVWWDYGFDDAKRMQRMEKQYLRILEEMGLSTSYFDDTRSLRLSS